MNIPSNIVITTQLEVTVVDKRITVLGFCVTIIWAEHNTLPNNKITYPLVSIICVNINNPGNFWKVTTQLKGQPCKDCKALTTQKWKGAKATLIIIKILIMIRGKEKRIITPMVKLAASWIIKYLIIL